MAKHVHQVVLPVTPTSFEVCRRTAVETDPRRCERQAKFGASTRRLPSSSASPMS